MADAPVGDRLQPALLDRLTDREPDKKEESRARSVVSLRRLRESVIRDLGWLFNTTRYSVTDDLSAYPRVAKSVINYGITDLSGKVTSSLDPRELERSIRQAVIDFEPRVLPNGIPPDGIRVRVNVSDDDSRHAAVTFEIEAALWAQPTPTRLFLKTRVDLESGDVRVDEQAGS
ncbi:MAG: type VI secretion system baseplate subunit TssE [Pseudomonadota bacterium]